MIRPLYIAMGWIFVAIGVIGIVTPLLPTTPFLLLAAGCFAKSSDRFHTWLMTHPKLSQPIVDWQASGVIRRPAKMMATALILLNAIFPLFIIKTVPAQAKLLVAFIITMVLVFIWTRPSTRCRQERNP